MTWSRNQSRTGNKNFKNRNNSFNENPKEYIEKIKCLLDVENATADQVKDAVVKIELGIKKMSDEPKDSIVKSHQLRTIFSLLKEVKKVKDLNYIIPRLKYVGARQKGKTGKFVVNVIVELIYVINSESNIETQQKMIKGLIYIMESIIAFHKFHLNTQN